jgi:hypothetical protein
MNKHIVEKYSCQTCGKHHMGEYDAVQCCPNQADKVWVCSICREYWFIESDAAEHTHSIAERTPTEAYLDSLRDGQPMLGEWQATMESEMEFLIPNA